MGSNQLLLIVAALAILITLQLSINGSLIRSFVADLDGEATIDAVSVGEAMIDEIQTKAFDEQVVANRIFDLDLLTASNSLTREGSTENSVSAYEREPFQSKSKFNDADDYNRYTRIVSSPRLGDYKVKDTVYYVSGTSLDSASNTRTWWKKIEVTVTHPNLLFPVTVRSVVVYRQFF
jgi:hypothetical protein